jgi:pyrroloquinoline quinone biosynthesis protein D
MPSIEPMRSDEDAALASSSRPELAGRVRLTFDRARSQHVLLGPETVVVLNRTGADILGLCDGRRTVAEIVAELRERYHRVVDDEVGDFLARLVAKRFLEISDG